MRTMLSKGIMLTLALILGRWHGCGQGNFVNLNFESAAISGYQPGSAVVPITAALPGWSAIYNRPPGPDLTDVVWYDAISLGGPIISVNDAKTGLGVLPLEGQFSAFLFGDVFVSTTLYQTALVPANARSLLFYAGTYGGGNNGPFEVALGGQKLSLVPMASFPAYTIFGGDVSAMAGQVATLSFTALPPLVGRPNMLLLDNIQFSTQVIPEPSTIGLSALGAGLLGWLGRKRNGSGPT